MGSILKVTKYQLRDYKKTLITFYGIMSAIVLLVVLNKIINSKGEGNFSGLGVATLIFIFVSGISSFKTNFYFLQANNVSRKRFYLANILSLISLAVFMAVIEELVNRAFANVNLYSDIFKEIYGNNFIIASFLWSLAFYIFEASLGWVIGMIYYKCNRLMKTVVSLIPVFLWIIIGIIDNMTDLGIGKAIYNFAKVALGLTNNINSYTAVLSFTIGAIVLFTISFLLIRKIPIKD